MSAFDERVEKLTQLEKVGTLDDVYNFIRDVYGFVIPEGKEPGENAFNVLDYYGMEELGAFVKQAAAELASLTAERDALKLALEAGNGWKAWVEAGGGYRDAFLGWLKDVNAALRGDA
jgi:hypothetical protein